MNPLARACPIALLAVSLVVLIAQSATATTIVSIGGEGVLEIAVDGDLFFDTNNADLQDVDLFANESIEVGGSLLTLPTDPDATRSFLGLTGATSLDFVGDVYLDVFDFAGSIVFTADNIVATGSFTVGGDVVIGTPGTGGDICAGGGDVTIGIGGTLCAPGPIDGPIVIDGPIGGIPTPAPAVPEPNAALLFAAGGVVMLVSGRLRE